MTVHVFRSFLSCAAPRKTCEWRNSSIEWECMARCLYFAEVSQQGWTAGYRIASDQSAVITRILQPIIGPKVNFESKPAGLKTPTNSPTYTLAFSVIANVLEEAIRAQWGFNPECAAIPERLSKRTHRNRTDRALSCQEGDIPDCGIKLKTKGTAK